ncbi:hydantoinase/oxoprolinase family protein [Afifella sp. IM 167]|uniref:hydantoinase/oxoprolinase family protein n=1 Tax=Afifella sp. IM 167 TaxID=2033586 RepID=UPI001CCBBAB3|nr:hydantoinase/oxoprolinase family protein [Afifella sp. IM 167]
MTKQRFRLGVDIGGTFTDIVMIGDDGQIFSKKILSTPKDYSEAIEVGTRALFQELDVAPEQVREFVHATTVATNTIIERKGAKVGLVTTRGFRDVLEIARFRTPRLYDITYRKPDPLVPRDLRFEVSERIGADGAIVAPLDESELEAIAAAFEAAGVEAVAITLINSHVNAAHEQRLAAFFRERMPDIMVTASSDLVPQIGEYERTSTAVVNAYLRPIVTRYIEALKGRLDAIGITAPLMIMQSSGGIAPGRLVKDQPITIIESGPAAGVLGGARLAQYLGLGDMLVFDMGGTTAKATLTENGVYTVSPETEVGGEPVLGARMVRGAGYPVQVPTIDIAEVGAGGGSLAAVDSAGGITVGPRSAGSEPGPIAYGRGGTQPTVTDANLMLGYLNPEALVSGELSLDSAAVKAAFAKLSGELSVEETEAAYGVHLIANATMLRALRGVTSEKGRDPSQFAMMAIGGNGPVHACSLAEEAGVGRVVMPPVAGLYSALGMLFADVEHQLVTAFYHRFDETDRHALQQAIDGLVAQGRKLLDGQGFAPDRQDMRIDIDMKYVGQTAPLTVTLAGLAADEAAMGELITSFHDQHHRTFGYASKGEPLQFVAVKAVCRGIPDAPRMPEQCRRGNERSLGASGRKAYFGLEHGWCDTPVITRAEMKDAPRAGPLIVEEYDTTCVIRPGWEAKLDHWNNIHLTRTGEAAQ